MKYSHLVLFSFMLMLSSFQVLAMGRQISHRVRAAIKHIKNPDISRFRKSTQWQSIIADLSSTTPEIESTANIDYKDLLELAEQERKSAYLNAVKAGLGSIPLILSAPALVLFSPAEPKTIWYTYIGSTAGTIVLLKVALDYAKKGNKVTEIISTMQLANLGRNTEV